MKSRRGGLFSANLHPRMVSHEPKLFPGVVHGSPNAAAFEADASMHPSRWACLGIMAWEIRQASISPLMLSHAAS